MRSNSIGYYFIDGLIIAFILINIIDAIVGYLT